MELAAGVSESMLAGSQLTEVAGSFRNDIVVELENKATGRLGVYSNIELHPPVVRIRVRNELEDGGHTKTLDL